jgi:hypothetical protein
VKDRYHLFSATLGTNERLFALTGKDRKLYALSNDSLQHSIGNYQPAFSANKLAWVSFTAYGYKVHQANQQPIGYLGRYYQ